MKQIHNIRIRVLDREKETCQKIIDTLLFAAKIEKKDVEIYTNTVAEYVNLKIILAQNETIRIRLIDMQGRLVAILIENESQREGEIEKKLNIPAWLPGGDYLVSLVSKSGNRSVKLIKL